MTTNELIDSIGATISHKTNEVRAQLSRDAFRGTVLHASRLAPLSHFYVTDERSSHGGFALHVVFSLDDTHQFLILTTQLTEDNPRYISLTREMMATHWYERYAMDMFGIVAEGHPDPRRLVHHENIPEGTYPLRKDFAWNTKLEHASIPYPMHRVDGEGTYQIPVGPIHAGIIEPGHFRFSVAGERIITLEGKLFFTHKGVEKLLEGKTPEEALPFIERISGDMAASHALAFCQAVEKIAGCEISVAAEFVRSILCELERVTMHIHDLANIAGMGTGYTVMAAQGFRIKERLMQLSDRIVGNRFWRGWIVPGGVVRKWTEEEKADIKTTVTGAVEEMQSLLTMAMKSDGLRERLETTGVLKHDAALAYGAVGIAARGSGIKRDVRLDQPYAAYKAHPILVVTHTEGDVFARYRCRIDELEQSFLWIRNALEQKTQDASQVSCVAKDGTAVSAVESWRGELVCALHIVKGKIERCAPRDPSFCNWALFGELAPGNIVPDFPLCNKSLNLSYSGNDL